MYERFHLFALRGLIASMLFNVCPSERKQLVRAKPSFQGVLFLSPVQSNLLRACVAPDKYKKCCEEDNGWKKKNKPADIQRARKRLDIAGTGDGSPAHS